MKKINHTGIGIIGYVAKLNLKEVSRYFVTTNQWMITMVVIMGVETCSFLKSIGIKQRIIQIQKKHLRIIYGIDSLVELTHDVIKLAECGIIYTMKKTG